MATYRTLGSVYSPIVKYLKGVYNLDVLTVNFDSMHNNYQVVLKTGSIIVDYNGNTTSEFMEALERDYPELLV